MTIEARIRELGARHAQLDEEIDDAAKHPSTDTLQIAGLKKEKLRLKEEIEALKRRH